MERKVQIQDHIVKKADTYPRILKAPTGAGDNEGAYLKRMSAKGPISPCKTSAAPANDNRLKSVF